MSERSSKVAIVTGASTGIGRATAEALAKSGFKVYGTSRRPVSGGPAGVQMVVCDVSDERSVSDLVSRVVAETGRIDVLVNNAGLGITGAAEETSTQLAQKIFDVNVFGVLRAIRQVLPIMRQQRSGRIVNISSVLGFMPAPYMALYASTKHAIEGYSESLDHEVREFGIRSVLIEPAYTRTSFDVNAIEADQSLPVYDRGRANADKIMKTAMQTGDHPEVVAKAVLEAVNAKAPKLRYTAGKLARQVGFLRRFVPASAFDKSLRKQNGLPA